MSTSTAMTTAASAPIPETHTIYVSSLPPSTHIGLNTSSFTVPVPFSGLLLPPALHLLWTSPPPHTLRHALFLLPPTTPSSYIFSPTTESLLPSSAPTSPPPTPPTPYTLRSPTTGTESTHLAHSEWLQLTSHISPATLTRILGPTPPWTASSISQRTDAPAEDDDTAHLPTLPDSEPTLNLQSVQLKHSWPPGATGRERTDAARDKGWLLGTKVDVLGEVEVCFLLGLYVGNPVALEQWGVLVRMVMGCARAVVETPGFWEEFLRVLGLQVGVVMAGFSGEAVDVEWVEGCVRGWWRGVREEVEEEGGEEGLDKGLRKEWGVFKERAEGWGWCVDEREMVRRGVVVLEDGEEVEVEVEGAEEMEERGEWAPTVVVLNEEGGEGAKGKREESDDDMPVLEYAVEEDDDDPRF